jgi:hypothetical protein
MEILRRQWQGKFYILAENDYWRQKWPYTWAGASRIIIDHTQIK